MKSPEKIKMVPEKVNVEKVINLTVAGHKFTISDYEAIDIINYLSGVLLVKSAGRCGESEKKYSLDLREAKGSGLRSLFRIRGKGSKRFQTETE